MSRGCPLDIAIIGMGCRHPSAPDLFAYWENVLAGRDARPGRDGTETPPRDEDDEAERSSVTDAMLAAFEDAGLTPDEIDSPRVAVVGRDGAATSALEKVEQAAKAPRPRTRPIWLSSRGTSPKPAARVR